MFNIEIAGITIGIDNKYDYTEKLAQLYKTDKEPMFTVKASEEDIDKEGKNFEGRFSKGYFESLVIYRNIANELYKYDAFVFHGAVLNYDGKAYVFTAKSGVGKTTHTRLWLSQFGDKVHYLNGDKPIIRFFDGIPYAAGTPWQGKENYGANERAPIEAIAFLSRAENNSAQKADADEAVVRLVTQMFVPKEPVAAMHTLMLADKFLKSVRLVDLRCNMDPDAALISHAAMTGTDKI